MNPLPPHLELIQKIHDAPHHGESPPGGGVGRISDLFAIPGSRTSKVVGALHPLLRFYRLSARPEQFCSSTTARQMAVAAYRRAVKLRAVNHAEFDPAFASWPAVGLGCTASLASDRPKHGTHRVHAHPLGDDGGGRRALRGGRRRHGRGARPGGTGRTRPAGALPRREKQGAADLPGLPMPLYWTS